MIEKKAKKGVLIYGKDSEEFDRENFDQVCKKVRDYILQHGPSQKSTALTQEEKKETFSLIGKIIPNVYRAFRRMTIIPSRSYFEKFVFDNELVNWLGPPKMFTIRHQKIVQNEIHYVGNEGSEGLVRYGVINEEGVICFQELLYYVNDIRFCAEILQ